MEMKVNLPKLCSYSFCGLLFAAFCPQAASTRKTYARRTNRPASSRLTAYVVESAKGHTFSHPAIGLPLLDASEGDRNFQTFSIAEGFRNRAEVGYTRSQHMLATAMSQRRRVQPAVELERHETSSAARWWPSGTDSSGH